MANLTSSGLRIGDGTTASYILDVKGTANVSSNLTVGGTITATSTSTHRFGNITILGSDEIRAIAPSTNLYLESANNTASITLFGGGSSSFYNANGTWSFCNSVGPAIALTIASNGNISNSNVTSNTIGGVTLFNGTAKALTVSSPAGNDLYLSGIYNVIRLGIDGSALHYGSGPWTFSNSSTSTTLFNIASSGNISNSNATSNTIGGVTLFNGTLGVNCNTPAYTLDVTGSIRCTNGYRMTFSNVSTTTLTITTGNLGTHYYLTSPYISNITLPAMTTANDKNGYWVFRNTTSYFMNTVFFWPTVNAQAVSAPTSNYIGIPPSNSLTVMHVDGVGNYCLVLGSYYFAVF